MNQNTAEPDYMFEDWGPVEPPTPEEFFEFQIEAMRFEGELYEDIIRFVRKQSGLSIQEAAARTGVTPGRLLDWELGAVRPTWASVRRLAIALALIEGRDEPLAT